MIADCRKAGAVWEVPYGSILPRGAENVLVVGRCSAAEGYAWQITRLIPAAALTGQVAGLAAKLALDAKTTPDKLEARTVQGAMQKAGVELHL